MNLVLEDRPLLAEQITEIAEVAGHLWQKGWAERNGGNITVNISAYIDDGIKSLKAISEAIPIGRTLPFLKGCWFFCKGTNKRMRDLARRPMENGSIVRITEDCSHYEIVADRPVKPTSEIISHLSIHNYLIGKNSSYKAVLHTHPIDLIAMTHNPAFLGKDVLSYLLWSMIPETRAFCPRGLGIIPYSLPGSAGLADATIKELDEYDVVMWEKHGVVSVSDNITEAFDMVDTLSKSAQIYLTAKSMGFEPQGMSREQMDELKTAFNLPK
jgi:rhamnulose-1-phosphate aldolase